jgi:hypothetical protein
MKEFQKAFSIMLVIISCGEILNSSLFGKAEKIAYLFRTQSSESHEELRVGR